MIESNVDFSVFDQLKSSLLARWNTGEIVTVGVGYDVPPNVVFHDSIDFTSEDFTEDTFERFKGYILDEITPEEGKKLSFFRLGVNYSKNGFIIRANYYNA